MITRTLIHKGHLIDSGLLSQILDLILEEGADYEIINFDVGKVPDQESSLRLELKAEGEELLEMITEKLNALGVQTEGASEAIWVKATRAKAAPENFYSTTNHRSEVFVDGKWQTLRSQRMDAAVVLREDGPECVKLRDLAEGDSVLVGSKSVRVHPPDIAGGGETFAFMANDVSSERNATQAAKRIADEMRQIRSKNGKIIAVAGPVVVHTGGANALALLIRDGWIAGFLGGNAVAVHDLECQLFGTSLGVENSTGRPTHGGHKNHMRAINRVYSHGSIRGLTETGILKSGLMYEILEADIPYCLAGSIRDDGPLPETEVNMTAAQNAYADIIAGAEMIIMLSTMLHSIGTGNITPSWVKTVCVDINPAVVTKLSNRGTSQAVGVVSDVGFFLRTLASALGITVE